MLAKIRNSLVRSLMSTHLMNSLMFQWWNQKYISQNTINGKLFANDLEATYVSRKKYGESIREDYDVRLPIGLDRPNRAKTAEMCMNRWNTPFDEHEENVLEKLYLKH